jgi:hypothetical protein
MLDAVRRSEKFANLMAAISTKQSKITKKRTLQPTISFTEKQIRKIKCKECSMEYRPSVPDDLKLHTKYHQSKLTITFNNPQISNRIEKFKNFDIYPVAKDSEIINKVNNLLGGTHLELGQLFTLVACIGKTVHACVILEPVTNAFRIVDNGNYDSLQCDQTKLCECTVGVSRIWVGEQSRRQGLAIKMLDVARLTFRFGMEIDKSELAFSQPTPSGHKLAKRYFGRSDYLVYL